MSKNTYFMNGYANVVRADDGKIVEVTTNGFNAVFPMDNIGDYFYLRNDGSATFQPQVQDRVSDHGPARIVFNDIYPMVLVAVVKKADPYELMNNLRNTAMMYSKLRVIPTGAQMIREQVVINELSGMEDDNIAAALQRLDRQTIISINLAVTSTYTPSSCINEICKTC